MIYNLGIEEQRRQLIAVIDYLKSTGRSQKEIAIELGVDNVYMSHLRSGTIKYIPPEVIEGLHEAYSINPKFITHGASNMFDTAGLKYENFDNFVDSWDLVEHENKEYLHFSMDENFYKFLIDVFNFKNASSNSDDAIRMAEAFDKATESLMENYPSSNHIKEYVLIPADVMLDIAVDNIPKRKHLGEVVDIIDFYPPKEQH
ncbi:MAG: hypothetical protein K2K46_10620 [Lachnospiraceae bacterium]|nr:hypothetical protein [Lachnospiraceae bacterium]